MEQRLTWRLSAVSAVVGLVVAVASVFAAGPWDSGQRTAERARAAGSPGTGGERHGGGPPRPAPSASPVLAPLGTAAVAPSPDSGDDAVPQPTRAGLADALEPLLDDGALGKPRSVSVVDAATGRQLYGTQSDTQAVPASIIKLATGVAALSALGPDHRIETTVVVPKDAGSGEKGEGEAKNGTTKDRIVLVGGGDPTLTAHATKGADAPASLRKLADKTASALKKSGTESVRLGYDTSLYSGPVLHPIGPNENISPVTPLMVDEGRLDDSDHGPAPRSQDPAADAAEAFASMLRDRGIDVRGEPRSVKAGKKARPLATVRSQPLSGLVERALTNSDNDIAEALARQTALAAGEPASFDGAGRAVMDRLNKLRLPLSGARIADGSGLDRADHVSAALLAQVLVRAADPDHPELRPVLTGLPVAGFTGTLRGRYAQEAVGRGVVRAKTGTLTGVNTLAGTVVDADGRLLVFAFMTNGTNDPQGAQRALDRMASALANCGCR
ncbi:D-alanyl-D-alanine carboxypeptidase/D-alanyl-D-alanine-endopeptidase [Streptomyces sp. ME19-01-6]|nr:D-alanyl-D-alanine carboxypeptidase/D-alanyl-D-alanine-endopeptidase [Streptomyces sp. ME19-01-6]MDX3228271.1 D-alanyl-D-alanine carboxypeptidase/D-alanyl-D-alanine-endopeptidase [Streptomyces sp. ME19-01-6]